MNIWMLAFSLVACANFEEVPRDEERSIAEVKALIERSVLEQAAKEKSSPVRDAHRKTHGCVSAQLQVSNVPEDLAVGLFAQKGEYRALVRFSNGSGQVQDDREGDGRGVALKVFSVKGVRISNDQSESQDFLLINHPVFFVRNAYDYVAFQKAAMADRLWMWLLNPRHVFHETLIANAIRKKTMLNPLESQYFSMTASSWGETPAKFSLRPCKGSQILSPDQGFDRLAKNLKATLERVEGCFEFQVQRRLDPDAMPVEDPTIEWSQQVAPYVTVAKLLIPKQTPVVGQDCDDYSFNPWRGLEAHRPLGGISRVRRVVYETISTLRGGSDRGKL